MAPTKEIGRKFDPKEIEQIFSKMNRNNIGEENEDQTKEKVNKNQVPYELNYYDLNDSFINDEEVASDNSAKENEFCKVTLQYGNYSEDAVIKNLERSKKLRKNKKPVQLSDKKKNNLEVEDVEMTGLISPCTISTPVTFNSQGKNNKRKLYQLNPINDDSNNKNYISLSSNLIRENNEKEEDEKDMKISNSNNLPPEDHLDNLVKDVLSTGQIIKDSKEKIILIKKLITNYKKFSDNPSKLDELLSKINTVTEISTENLKIIFDFEILKIKREGIFSNLAKQINKLINNFTEQTTVRIISDKLFTELDGINEEFNNLISKFKSYIESVQIVW